MCLECAVDRLVSTGIRAYIGLLGCGERQRSRLLFRETLQLSAFMSGGPSARIVQGAGWVADSRVLQYDLFEDGKRTAATVPPRPAKVLRSPVGPLSVCMIALSLRSLLASLLVLKVTVYWKRLPVLPQLHAECVKVAAILETGEDGHGTSGRTAELNSGRSHEPGTVCGCRRSSALPTVPELSEQPVRTGIVRGMAETVRLPSA